MKTFDTSVAAIVRDGSGRILLIKRSETSNWSKGLWECPGGKPDPGEHASEALVREAKEETGLDIEPFAFAGTGDFEHPRTHVVVNYFHAKQSGDDPVKLSFEHSEFKWLPLADALRLELTPPTKQILSTLES